MRIVTPQTEQDWQSYFALRWRLLRAPWQQPKGSEQDELEQSAYHVMAKTAEGKTVGVGRIHYNTTDEWQIRYMAVDEAYRGKGIGAMILQQLESYARSKAGKRITLNARESAIEFYLRNNYLVCGDAPILFGAIKHKRMRKILINPDNQRT